MSGDFGLNGNEEGDGVIPFLTERCADVLGRGKSHLGLLSIRPFQPFAPRSLLMGGEIGGPGRGRGILPLRQSRQRREGLVAVVSKHLSSPTSWSVWGAI